MLSTFINSYKVSFVEDANVLIHFLKRIPLIGKKIPDKLYGQTDTKLIIGVIRQVLNVIGQFIRKALYLGIVIYLPAWFMQKKINPDTSIIATFLIIFTCLNLFEGSIVNVLIFNPTKEAFNMISLMRVNPRDYFLSQIIYKMITSIIYFIIPLLVIGFSPVNTIMLLLELTGFRLLGEFIHVYFYDRKKVALVDKSWLIFVIMLIALVGAYGLPIIFSGNLDFAPVIFNPIFFIIVVIVGILSYLYLYNFKHFMTLAKERVTKSAIFNKDKIMKDARFADVRIDDKKMSSELLNTEKFNNKQGFEYLNSIFFFRHRKIVENAIKTRVIIIVAVFAIFSIAMFFVPKFRGQTMSQITNAMPVLVFLMYCLSTTERICKAMFFNCDNSLLRYGYYREGKVILANFRARLKKMIFFNSIPALTICLGMLILGVALDGTNSIVKIIPNLLCVLCLSAFFSIHYLFMYYVLQPYTSELTVKSPLFSIVNFAVYMVCYGCLQIKVASYYFTLGVIVATIVYMVVAVILTNRLAPKTFKLK